MVFCKAYASLDINIPVVLGRLLRHFVPRKILFHPMLLSDRDFANKVKQSFVAFCKAHDKIFNGITRFASRKSGQAVIPCVAPCKPSNQPFELFLFVVVAFMKARF